MIHFDRPSCPPEFATDKRIGVAKTEIRKVVATDPGSLTDDHFVDRWRKYREAFSDAQGDGKCGYCETRVKPGSKGRLDHYRPKAKVHNVKSQGSRIPSPKRRDRKRELERESTIGYWWLAYSWDNWILTCESCNSAWKGAQFPCKRPVVHDCTVAEESPLLLNPFEGADIEEHFDFSLDGEIIGVTDEARETIAICGLDRWDLVDARMSAIEDYLKCADDFEVARKKRNAPLARSALSRVARMCLPKMAFAGTIRRIIDSRGHFSPFTWKDIVGMLENGDLTEPPPT